MLRSLIDKIKAIPQLLERLRSEPILVVGFAMIMLTAWQTAVTQGLSGEDFWIALAQAALTWLGRELVYPAAKVESDPTLSVKQPLGTPYIPGGDGE